jgi:hypothetical protein
MIKMSHKFNRAIWDITKRKSIINKALKTSANRLEYILKDYMSSSEGGGREYKIPVSRARYRETPRGQIKIKRSYRIHRASSQGEPPAIRSGQLYRSLKVRMNPERDGIQARAQSPGARVLDDPFKLNRPFFAHVVKKYFRTYFKRDMIEAVRDLLDA